ncbi:hypothetical protein BB347_00610 [Natronorubrum daqingense]|uniref:Uncharacterized protein n=1 Tax=Natronorubrum daqingense TaxID=588898 RepID=A0A1P8R967_9EURY|nr:hypothetical protein BB347_00610 [Natronorubrum daqingense]
MFEALEGQFETRSKAATGGDRDSRVERDGGSVANELIKIRTRRASSGRLDGVGITSSLRSQCR